MPQYLRGTKETEGKGFVTNAVTSDLKPYFGRA